MSDDPQFDLDVVMAEIAVILHEHPDISSQVVLVSKTHGKSRLVLTPAWSNQNAADATYSHSMPLEPHNEKDHAWHSLMYLLVTNKFFSKMLLHFVEQLNDGKIPAGTEFNIEGIDELDWPF